MKLNLLLQMLLLSIFLQQKEKKKKIIIWPEISLLGLPAKSWPAFSPVAFKRHQLAIFRTTLVLAIFLQLHVAFRKERSIHEIQH